ncbi:MAG: 3-dehydroquinate synthase [Planctomycetes bacterium]|nr:3-dehydroquinate synthase [Planctomycetota bacterium]
MNHPQSFSVGFGFDLRFTEDVFAPENDALLEVLRGKTADARPSRCLVYVDDGCLRGDPGLPARILRWFSLHDPKQVQLAAAPEVVSGGEKAKRDFGLVDSVGRTAFDRGICRHSYIIVVGGGAVLDAVGFAAALIHRGVRCVRIPTTTLAQCDAGLGVKNGINAYGAKNFFGTFQAPYAIINDARFLHHLDDRSWRAGAAEAFKVAIIKDRGFLADLIAAAPLIARRDPPTMRRVIERCALAHLDHITQGGDAFERGSSRPLDFGHWSAHRLEVLSQHRLQHGEAVAIGVAIDLFYAVGIARLTRDDVLPIVDALAVCGFRLWDECLDLREADGTRTVLAGLAQFREHLGGELTLAMPDGLGARRDIHEFDPAIFERALKALRQSRAAASGIHPAQRRA